MEDQSLACEIRPIELGVDHDFISQMNKMIVYKGRPW